MRDISKAAFYISYYQAAQKLDKEERGLFYDVILGYIFEGKEPVETSFNIDLLFTSLRPFIDADLKRKSGGAPLGNENAKKQPQNNLENNVQNNLKTNNVNGNGNVNDNVNENGNGKVNGNYTNLPLPKKTKDKITKLLSTNEISTGFLDYCYDFVKAKYPQKELKDLAGLFTSAVFEWSNTRVNYYSSKPTETIKIKKPKPPKSCTFCGSKLVLGGMPNSYECPSCSPRTWWELSNNVWTCNR